MKNNRKEKCLLPSDLINLLLGEGYNPCASCLEDRSVCGSPAPKPKWFREEKA